MIYSEQTPVAFNDPLPGRVDVVVIGGGVIGISTAYFLAKQGVSVAVCEKGRVAGEQSSRNWGWVRQQGRDPDELPIMTESLGIWDGLARETGEDFGFTRCGVTYLADDAKELAGLETWMEVAKQHQLDTRVLGKSEVDDMISDANGQWHGALITPSDGRAEPWKAVPALARAARAEGTVILENCAVRTIESEGGRVGGVVTEKGTVKTSAVVCAGGVWSSLFLRNLGIDLPQLTVKSCVAATGPATDIFQGNAASSHLAFRRRQDGGYTIALGDYHEHYVSRDSFRHFFKFLPNLKLTWRKTHLRFGDGLWERLFGTESWSADEETPFERNRVVNPAPTPAVVNRMHARMAKYLPSLADVPLAETWAGMIDTMPDVVPVMDETPSLPGLFLATGFSGHGFGIGPGAGRVMADLIQGRPTGHDLTRFRFSRFSDGSPITLGPAL